MNLENLAILRDKLLAAAAGDTLTVTTDTENGYNTATLTFDQGQPLALNPDGTLVGSIEGFAAAMHPDFDIATQANRSWFDTIGLALEVLDLSWCDDYCGHPLFDKPVADVTAARAAEAVRNVMRNHYPWEHIV